MVCHCFFEDSLTSQFVRRTRAQLRYLHVSTRIRHRLKVPDSERIIIYRCVERTVIDEVTTYDDFAPCFLLLFFSLAEGAPIGEF